MNRLLTASLTTVLTLFALPFSTSAQEEALFVTTIDGDGNPSTGPRVNEQDRGRGVNRADCDGTATITLQTVVERMGPADLWIGDGDCTTEAARNVNTATCFHVGHIADINDNTFDVSVQDLISARSTVCDVDDEDLTVYVLFEAGNPYRGPVGEWASFTVKIDGIAPNTPNISDGNLMLGGDSQVRVGWEAVNDDMASFEVLDAGDCDGMVLADAEVLASANQGARTATINPTSDLGLEQGETGAVTVVSVDQAGNRSDPSVEICVERIPVAGFCEVFTEMGGSDCEESGCSVGAPGSGGSGAPVLFVLLALLWTRRS